MKTLATFLLAALSVPAASWTDRAEYDLVLGIRAELLPQKRLALLDAWKAKYPKSEYQQARRELYFAAYQALGDNRHMLDIAAELAAAQPNHALAGYWLTVLLPDAGSTSPDRLALGEKTATLLLNGGNELLARRALGWIHWQRSEYPDAEKELRACLRLDPTRAETAAWLGTVLALEAQPGKQATALWYMARAVALKGDGVQLKPVLERLYTSYHGEPAGLDQVLAAAASASDPPSGFDIESAAAAAIRKQDETLARDNPRLGEWVKMRRQLESADGERYFNETLHNNPLARLKGTLIRGIPETRPTELVVGVVDPATPEIVLKLAAEFPKAPVPGAVIEFEGTVDSFTKAPFTLTLTTEAARISK